MAYRRLQVFDQLHGRRSRSDRRWHRPGLPVLLGLLALALVATLALLALPVFGRPASAALPAPAAPDIERPAPVARPGEAPDSAPRVPPSPTVASVAPVLQTPDEPPSASAEPAPTAAPADEAAEARVGAPSGSVADAGTEGTAAPPATEDPAPAAAAPAEPAYLLELPGGDGEPVQVPILMYHHIGGLPEEPDELRVGLTLSVDDFAGQLAFLHDNGYQTVTLNDLVAAMYGEAELPERPVVLTFDDGYLDHYTDAFPLLQEYGFIGTFFIVTSLVGDGEYVTWDHLREMAAAGMRIEAHGLTHRDLRFLGSDEIRHEAVEAKLTLEEEVGQAVRFYCYPAGKYTDETPDILAEAGYLGAVTVRHGFTADPAARFEIPRVRINRGDGAFRLAEALGASK